MMGRLVNDDLKRIMPPWKTEQNRGKSQSW